MPGISAALRIGFNSRNLVGLSLKVIVIGALNTLSAGAYSMGVLIGGNAISDDALVASFRSAIRQMGIGDWALVIGLLVILGNAIPAVLYMSGTHRRWLGTLSAWMLYAGVSTTVACLVFWTVLFLYPTPVESDVANLFLDIWSLGGLPFAHSLVAAAGEVLFLARRLFWISRGSCPSCGYILNGNSSGQCSECGHSREQDKAGQAYSVEKLDADAG